MGDRKRKRQESFHEGGGGGKTVKGIFKRDDLDDSISLSSDLGIIINENVKMKRRTNARSIKFEHEPLNLSCDWDACHENFSDYEVFITHLMKHFKEHGSYEDDVETYKCYWSDCSHVADSLSELNQHLIFHGYHTKLKCVGRNVEFRLKLPECTQSESFVIPIVPNGYACEWEHCHEVSATIVDFLQHMKLHSFHTPKGSKEGDIKCGWKLCTSNSFPTQYKLIEHIRIHSRERLIACPTCGYLFANRTKYCDHRRRQIPISQQSFLCSQCSKFFPSERLLRDHMRLHVMHYKCSMCEMTCSKPSVLAKHMRFRHLAEKPFKCHQCDYRGVEKHNLITHLKVHDPDMEFSCEDCEFQCRSSFGLEQHLQKAHNKGMNNVYECHHCSKHFGRGGFLTRHLIRIHDYIWPSGHSRFRYKEDSDGLFRLQTVRYETLDVTEEIIKGKLAKIPPPQSPMKFEVETISADVFEIHLVTKTKKKPPEGKKNKVVITIDDIDAKGNILKSQTIPSEIICGDVKSSFPADLFLDCDDNDCDQ